jgi:ferredoxin-nitrite reductase
MSTDFTPEQKRYLEGFAFGFQVMQRLVSPADKPPATAAAVAAPIGPDAPHIAAQDATVATGKKLADQEKWKRAEHPFDAYPRLKQQAATNTYPKPDDNFRWRYYGLFYVAPAQNSYMCRLRIPNGIVKHWQLMGLADVADTCAGGFSHVTTRANLQMREIEAKNAVRIIEAIQDLGLSSRGAGADNIRNVTGGATAGIDPQELIDTRRMAREWHFHILNDRSLYGLPRKFNVAFDGGGRIATLEETNDIGFQAVEIVDGANFAGDAVEAGVWMRLALGGVTGHRDIARDTGVIVRPEETTQVADAVVRVFIDHGNRTDRAKARLKYVLDDWGFDRFLAAVEEKIGRRLTRIDPQFVKPRPPSDRLAHLGVHAQKQPGQHWVGVALPLGKITSQQMRALAVIARDKGDGDLRLTVWQNLIVSGVPTDKVEAVKAALNDIGLDWQASRVRAGLVACTGNKGCKFAASDTKGHGAAIADHCDASLKLDTPINIHLTGCHHSCAQHYVGDIGLVGARVAVGDDGDTVEGYNVVIGGGYARGAKIARELVENVKAENAPALVERLLKVYLARRQSADESFQAFADRHAIDELKRFAEEIAP